MYSYRTLSHNSARAISLVALILAGLITTRAFGQELVPVIKNLELNASVSFDPSARRYDYAYRLTSLSANTGNVSGIEIDITMTLKNDFQVTGPVPEYREAVLENLSAQGIKVLPVELTAPDGWGAVNLSIHGTASWFETAEMPILTPGRSLEGLTLSSAFSPGIRLMTVHPDISTWNLYPDADDPEAVIKEKEALIRSLDFTGYTLGPVGVTPGSFAHWNQVRADLNKAIELGWVPDATLASNLLSQLAAARKALNAGDGTAAKAKLHTLIETVMGASDAQRRPEVRDLLGLNAEALIRVTPNTPVPFELETDFTPRKTQVPVGTEHTVTATAVNVALDNAPVPGHPFDLQISAGPHAGQSFYGYTDAQGRFRFGYTGVRLGTDLIVSYAGSMETDSLQVTWVGGADLAVPLFVPPLLKSEGGKTVFITDITRNLGTIGAPASTTRYYLSESPPPFDTASATLVGERAVPPLGAREDSNVDQVPFVVPAGLAKGTYYLAACADARAEVIELDETNNCSFSEIQGVTSVVVAAEPPQNHPPDCTLAHADPATLWPPNHRLVNVAIEGVSDPDHDPVSLTVTAITQDEPVNGLGDGDAGPDGFGVGQVSVRLRSERSGTGNGRVYAIVVAADDGRDGRCDATVRVGVPHDYGEGANPVDDGQQYDSTML